MAAVKDYYNILGVSKDADQKAIKKAYRKLAQKYHPDRNPDDAEAEDRFKEVQEAYSVLSDEQKRAEYDRARRGPFGGGGGGPGFEPNGGGSFYRSPDGTYVRFESQGGGPRSSGDFGDFAGFEAEQSFGDIFSRIFGQEPSTGSTRRRRRPSKGRDVETTLQLSFEQALRGGKTTVTLPDGQKVRLNIPKGVRSGTKIRLPGRGQHAPTGDGRRGDLYVVFEVAEHPRFRREGDDLHTTVAVSALEAILGTTRSLTTAYGKRVKLTIAPGTQPGARLRLKGQGVETEKGKGDLYVEVDVHIPEKLTDEQRKTLRKAAKDAGLL